jgi:hypothetical protein
VLVSARRSLLAVCVSCGCLALVCSSALASAFHPFLGQFGSFAGVQGVAVDQASGDVFVYATDTRAVYKFSASGEPEEFSHTKTNAITVPNAGNGEGEIAVDSSAGPAKGDIYVAHGGASSSVLIFNEAGEQVGELSDTAGRPWGEACGVAVDPAGNVYVGLYPNHVNKYTPSTSPVTDADYSGSLYDIGDACNVAADASGNAYVDTWPSGPVSKFEASQFNVLETPAIGVPVTPGGSTLAVEPSTNDLYVDEHNQVAQFNAAGTTVDTFAAGAISGSYGIAVDGSTHDVLVASKSNGNGSIDVYGPLGVYPPAVESEGAADVTAESASLLAQIDPDDEETTYRFEYGTSEAYGQSTPESSPIGSGLSGLSVTAHIQGLQAATTYHYRVVATSAVGQTLGADHTFTTQQTGKAFAMLDYRQYEMVSPPNKQGALINALDGSFALVEAAANGDAITYGSHVPTEAEPVGFNSGVQNLSTRGPSSWQTRDLTVPHSEPVGSQYSTGPEYRFFSSDLSHALVKPVGLFTPCENAEGIAQPCMSPEASEPTTFLTTDFFNGNVDEACLPRNMLCAQPLVSACPKAGEPCPRIVEEHADALPGAVFGGLGGGGSEFDLDRCLYRAFKLCGPEFISATPDLSHVLIQAEAQLTPEAPTGEGADRLYEWSAGHLKYVGESEVAQFGGPPGADRISADGSRVLLKHDNRSLEGPLLMRDTATSETFEIGADAEFEAASSDFSRVFFGIDPPGENFVRNGLDVFEVTSAPGEPFAGKVTSLTDGADLVGRAFGASEDGSYVYFVSNGVLAGSGATSPGDNLYVDHYDGSEWKPTFIAALAAEDDGPGSGDSYDWEENFARQPVRVSPNGQWVAFMSEASLTGYDNRDAVNGRADAEVYLYHASFGGGSATLSCASCEPTGARPAGEEFDNIIGSSGEVNEAWSNGMVAAFLPSGQQVDSLINDGPEDYQSRYLSNSGRLYFTSMDSLVPDDVDGTPDVYEYEPEGAGDCNPAVSSGSVVFEPAREFDAQDNRRMQGAGCVGLISSGTSSSGSWFLDASETGGDVFFLTTSKLAPQDQDSAYDVYDAHECTAVSPCLSAPVGASACETEASCRTSPTPQPSIYASPPSATFSGPGNLTLTPSPTKVLGKKVKCEKGRVRNKRGRCVKRAGKKAKKASRATRRTGR